MTSRNIIKKLRSPTLLNYRILREYKTGLFLTELFRNAVLRLMVSRNKYGHGVPRTSRTRQRKFRNCRRRRRCSRDTGRKYGLGTRKKWVTGNKSFSEINRNRPNDVLPLFGTGQIENFSRHSCRTQIKK